MKIAQLISNFHNVTPYSNQAIYSHVAWLTNKLVDQGNEVFLFAAGDSDTKASLVSVTTKATSRLKIDEGLKKHYTHLLISKCYSQAAELAGVQLIIAGRSYTKEGYWHKKIEKYIDEKNIRYIGEANFKQKVELYQNAKAVLFPTQYEEIFGLVMIEAMACGTPVIGWKKGSVPEVISDRKTGFMVDNISDMIKAIKKIGAISREETRKRAEIYFSIEKMVSGYSKIYSRVIEECKFKKRNHKGKDQQA